jgi:hypothetical protein
MVLPFVMGLVTGVVPTVPTWLHEWHRQQELEIQESHRQQDFEESLIQKAIDPSSKEQTKQNMRFLLNAGLISDPDGQRRKELDKFEIIPTKLDSHISWQFNNRPAGGGSGHQP